MLYVLRCCYVQWAIRGTRRSTDEYHEWKVNLSLTFSIFLYLFSSPSWITKRAKKKSTETIFCFIRIFNWWTQIWNTYNRVPTSEALYTFEKKNHLKPRPDTKKTNRDSITHFMVNTRHKLPLNLDGEATTITTAESVCSLVIIAVVVYLKPENRRKSSSKLIRLWCATSATKTQMKTFVSVTKIL